MFKRIFLEKHLVDSPKVQLILKKFKSSNVKIINKVEDVFGKVKKPYLQKKNDLNLFIGEKKGELVKVAPDAYGLSGDPHFYFVHAYNCIYECNYCYLQGYFHSPDIVIFINHEDIANRIKEIAKQEIDKDPDSTPWFHAGEFSDSLALSHITGEIPHYFNLFKEIPQAKLEFRTKSTNIKELLNQAPLPNVITSFSLSPEDKIKKNDLKTPSLNSRLNAIKSLHKAGHPIGIHFDPVIYDYDFKEKYLTLLNELFKNISADSIEYISIGVVRFTKDVYQQVKQNYPESELLAEELIKADDGKVRYARPMRMWILQTIKDLCLKEGIEEKRIYLCMEED